MAGPEKRRRGPSSNPKLKYKKQKALAAVRGITCHESKSHRSIKKRVLSAGEKQDWESLEKGLSKEIRDDEENERRKAWKQDLMCEARGRLYQKK